MTGFPVSFGLVFERMGWKGSWAGWGMGLAGEEMLKGTANQTRPPGLTLKTGTVIYTGSSPTAPTCQLGFPAPIQAPDPRQGGVEKHRVLLRVEDKVQPLKALSPR